MRQNRAILTMVAIVDVEVRASQAHASRSSHWTSKPGIVAAVQAQRAGLIAKPIQVLRVQAVCPDICSQPAAMEPDMLGGIGAGNGQRPAESVLECLPQPGQPICEFLSREVVRPQAIEPGAVVPDVARPDV